MKIIAAIIAFLVLCYGFLLLWGEWIASQDASFEASDGIWADRTVKFKGRDFEDVLWMFEAYKLTEGKEGVEMFRVTKKPEWWSLIWPRKEKDNPMWIVPYRPGNGLDPYIGRNKTEEKIDEINARAKQALEFWKEKAMKREQDGGINSEAAPLRDTP
jgi:hypothetical protein